MEKEKTPYPELDAVLEELAKNMQKALGNNFVGMYLQGSLAIGDFDMTSDVDFIIVINQDLSDEEVKKVQSVHTEIYNQDSRWAKRIEYSFFPKEKLRTPSSPFSDGQMDESDERKLWYFNNGSPTIERDTHDNTLVNRWTVREKGLAMLGPDPKTLINPVPPNDLRKEIKGTIVGEWEYLLKNPEHYRNRFYQAYLVLNFGRRLHDLYEGKVTSKLESAEWAKKSLDPKWKDLIEYCWNDRKDSSISVKQPANEKIFPRALEFVKYVVDEAKKYKI